MKRLIGGLILLNLTAISLGLTAGEVDITDEDVLEQLIELRAFIDEKRDFTKGFKDLKPVLLQYRSNASKFDGIVQCNLSFNTDALHMSIAGYSVQADGTPITITINVVYEWTDYIGYTIKSAKLNATNDLKTSSFNGITPTSSDSGKVLGIDANGNFKLITISGVTPLYYHGIHLESSSIQMQFVIFNNSPTAFTKDTCKEFLDNLLSDYNIINCNGCIKVDNNVYPVYIIVNVGEGGEVNGKILYHTNEYIQQSADLDSYWEDITYFRDGVNQLL